MHRGLMVAVMEDAAVLSGGATLPVPGWQSARQEGKGEERAGAQGQPLQCFLPCLSASSSQKPGHASLTPAFGQPPNTMDPWHPAPFHSRITVFVPLVAFYSDSCGCLQIGVPAFGIIPLKTSSSKPSKFQLQHLPPLKLFLYAPSFHSMCTLESPGCFSQNLHLT